MIISFIIFKFIIYNKTNSNNLTEKLQFSIGVNIHFVKPNIKEVSGLHKTEFKIVFHDDGRRAFSNFTKHAVERYKGTQIIWEIWNEHNGVFWEIKPNAEDYSKLAIETINAIRSKDKNAFIIAPALAGFDYSYLNFLAKSGLFKYIDAVSVHLYRNKNSETVIEDYKKLRELIQKYHHNKNVEVFLVNGCFCQLEDGSQKLWL